MLGVYLLSEGLAGTEVASVHGRSGETLILSPLPSRHKGIRDGTKESWSFRHVQSGVPCLLVSCMTHACIGIIMVHAYNHDIVELYDLLCCTVQVKQ